MKVAVFSDGHGNRLALQRFIDATRDEVDTYLCLGDIVNYGPWGDECLAMILGLPGIVILEGNHERLFLGTEPLQHEIPLVQSFFHHTRPNFENIEAISNLPSGCSVAHYECLHTIGNRSIYPDTEVDIISDCILGHTHHQFHRSCAGHTLINPGSIGQNREWIDQVDYAILDTSTRNIELRSLPYDFDAFVIEMQSAGYPPQCINYYTNKPRRKN